MNQPNVRPTDQLDSLLGEVVDEYLERLARGEQPKIERYAEEHPEIASLIRQTFPALQLVGQSVSEPSSVRGIDLSRSKQLGDFRLIRELGSGGMGFVYEAEQVSMGRNVALKVLPMAGELQQKSLQRFRNEVRAAASLDHPNIVSVYSVGEERGVHYYAMQLIRGQTLAEVIQQLALLGNKDAPLTGDSISEVLVVADQHGGSPKGCEPTGEFSSTGNGFVDEPAPATLRETQARISTLGHTDQNVPFFRSAARLGIRAAEGLQHAHDQGVLHRDIKPGNLMLDANAQLYITDFGLTRIETDVGLTMTGDLVGTLRYMSPEQALAKRIVVDHRSDIYSLGMTLYELLALRPPFLGANRQELLRQIAFEDPPKLRRISRSIPRDLETIILKAIEKNPDERYNTAGELADDLRAFLEDRSIKAKPPTAVQRMAKWSRRHSAAVIAAMILCVLTTCLVSVGAVLIDSERAKAVTSAELADKSAETANQSRRQAIRQRDESYYQQYVAQMRQGSQDWEDGQISRLLETLSGYVLQPSHADLRDWEWYYLLSLCEQSNRKLEVGDRHSAVVAVSPQGTHAVTGGAELKIWELPAWKHVYTLRGHVGPVRDVCWNPDGSQCASTGSDQTVRIWDPFDGRQLHKITPPLPLGKSPRVDWSPQGPLIAITWEGHSIRSWNAATGEAGPILDKKHDVYNFSWSPDGMQIAAVGGASDIRIWRSVTGKLLQRIPSGNDTFDVAWSPDGNLLATTTYGAKIIHIWNASAGQLVQRLQGHSAGIDAVAWSPDGSRLASGGRDETVILWDTVDWSPIHTFRGHKGWVTSVGWTPDGRSLISGDNTGELRIWDPELPPAPLRISFADIAGGWDWTWSPDPTKLIVLDRTNGEVTTWDAFSGDLVETLTGSTGPVEKAVWAMGGDGLATQSANQSSIDIWSADRQRGLILNATVKTKSGDQIKGINPTRRYLLTENKDPKFGIAVWEIATGQELLRVPGIRMRDAAWRPDGRQLAVSEELTLLSLWDLPSGRHHLSLSAGRWKKPIAWSPDGKQLAAGGFRQLVTSWNAETGKLGLMLSGHRGAVGGVAWSPRGSRIASSASGQVKIWDSTTGQEVLAFDSAIATSATHFESAELIWSPDGQCLAGPGDGSSIIVHNASRGYRLADKLRVSEDTPKPVAQRPEAPHHWIGRAHFLLDRQREDEYRALCQSLVSLPTAFSSPAAAETLSAVCALLPDALEDYRVPLGLARQSSTKNPGHAMLRMWLGALLYRSGQWEESRAELAAEERLSADWKVEDQALVWCWLAMADYRLGDSPRAQDWLDKALAVEIDEVQDTFTDRTLTRLRDEAEALLTVDRPN